MACPRFDRVKIAVAKETRDGEARVAMVPELVAKLTGLGYDVAVEPGAGLHALLADEEYAAAGATVDAAAFEGADLVVSVQPLTAEQIRRLARGTTTISFLPTTQEQATVVELRDAGITAHAVELIPRISRAQSMDALSSQALVSGYRCAIVAAGMLRRFFPLNMTAAGTVQPAEVVVLGAGVAGLQAIATAKRLGAVVRAYDVRAAAAEEIRSMGAKSIDLDLDTLEGAGGYAREMTEDRAARQRELLTPYIAAADALITTAAVPGRTAPMLVTREMVEQMKPGSVVVDLAAESGGNVEGSVAGEVVRIGNAQVWGGRNVPSQMPGPASRLYAQNVVNLVTLMTGKDDDGVGVFSPDYADEILSGSCVTQDGRIVHDNTREAIEGPTDAVGAGAAEPEPEPQPSRPSSPTCPTTRRPTSDPRHRSGLADDLRAQRLRRHRGDLQGLLDAAHAPDVRSQRHPRHHPARRDPGDRHHRQQPGADRRPGRDRAGVGEHGGRLRGHRPDAADVRPQEAGREEGRPDGRGSLMPTWIQLVFLACGVCFILALKGLSGPKTARNGNLLGAAAAVVACLMPFFWSDLHLQHVPLIIAAIVVGTVGGVYGAQRVQMTQMPQMVALFNGVGGGAAALVALLELHDTVGGGCGDAPWFTLAATAFTIAVGSISFAGSVVTFAKLQELMTSRPVVFPGLRYLFPIAAGAVVVLGIRLVIAPHMWIGILIGLLGLLLGLLLVLPVGGADVPIVISMLNAFTGLTVAAGGYVLSNVLLLIAGTLVGASGTFLTLLMASAMGRSVANILFGALKGGSTLGAGEASDRPVKSVNPEDAAIMLAYADRVIIVPGYGLAVAQAQHTLRELVDVLGEKGIEVDYAIHPVAGRMPGHMNVLLAEAQVPYEQLREMDEINGDFKDTDVVLIVGANDVVNPAAKTTPGAPIYGMPILNADEARQVIFMKRSMRPGFAGIENELLFDEKTSLLFGDAKDSMGKLLNAVKAL